ncbi:MAG: PqqD family protein [Myxococcales bacterium]|nr:MAG: PqqD family protein [Myxococcales bacterium]
MAQKLSPGARVTRSAATVWREIDGRTVVIHLDDGRVRTLNPTGSVVWQAIDNTTLADLHARLAAAFPDEPSERLAGDVEAFVAELVDRGLAQVEAG